MSPMRAGAWEYQRLRSPPGICVPEPRAEFYRHIDAANVDLKGFTESFYSKVCAGHLDAVLDTLLYIKTQTKVWLEITTLLIPGEKRQSCRNRRDDEMDC